LKFNAQAFEIHFIYFLQQHLLNQTNDQELENNWGIFYGLLRVVISINKSYKFMMIRIFAKIAE